MEKETERERDRERWRGKERQRQKQRELMSSERKGGKIKREMKEEEREL